MCEVSLSGVIESAPTKARLCSVLQKSVRDRALPPTDNELALKAYTPQEQTKATSRPGDATLGGGQTVGNQ